MLGGPWASEKIENVFSLVHNMTPSPYWPIPKGVVPPIYTYPRIYEHIPFANLSSTQASSPLLELRSVLSPSQQFRAELLPSTPTPSSPTLPPTPPPLAPPPIAPTYGGLGGGGGGFLKKKSGSPPPPRPRIPIELIESCRLVPSEPFVAPGSSQKTQPCVCAI